MESATSDNGERESESQLENQPEEQEQPQLEENVIFPSSHQSPPIEHQKEYQPTEDTQEADYFSEEIITKVIEQDTEINNSEGISYYETHHHQSALNDSYHHLQQLENLEKIEDTFSQHAYEEDDPSIEDLKEIHLPDQSIYDTSDKSYDNYEKDFENESGYEDFDRSFQENSSSHHYDIAQHNNRNHQHHHLIHHSTIREEPPRLIHRQHTFADIPPLPLKKNLVIKKQKTEDYTTTTTSSNSSSMPFIKTKSKPKPYPDPRKPAVYPQRLNKTTLARQALAREKRRIYVEERIQNFMRNTKSIQTPYGSLDRSFSIDRSNNHKLTTNSTSSSFSKISTLKNSSHHQHHHHHLSSSTTTLHHNNHRPNNHESLSQQINYRKSKIQSPQSLPDISIIDYYMTPSRGLMTSTPVGSSSSKPSKLSSHKSSHLSNSMSSIRSPSLGVAEVSVVSGSRGGGGGGGGGSSPRSSGIVIDSIPEETSDFWKAISSEEGYFYTFRVRQTGPVQMMDKAVQTQNGPMNFSKEFYTNYESSRKTKRAPPLNAKSSTITLPLIDDRKSYTGFQ